MSLKPPSTTQENLGKNRQMGQSKSIAVVRAQKNTLHPDERAERRKRLDSKKEGTFLHPVDTRKQT